MSNDNRPNIHMFEYLDGKYIYDVNKNAILAVSDKAYKEIKSNPLIKDEQERSNEVNRLVKKGFLSANRPKKILHPQTDMVESLLSKDLSRICLQVTQGCNFRCKYCVFSEAYDKVRKHSLKDMDWDMAKKSLDFLIEHSQDSLSIGVGFYGGEPLLKFDLLKKCMEYITSNVDGKDITFTLTTNGSLLTEEIIEEFLKYNVKVTISLDGPKQIQNKNRVFADGRGTFDVVTNNIKRLCEKYPELKERLSYSMVLDPNNGFSCIENFVEYDDNLFEGTPIMNDTISPYYREEELTYSDEFLNEWEYSKFKYMMYLLGKLPEKYNSRLIRSSFSQVIALMKDSREKYPMLSECEHHSGPCVPGQLRLFVNAYGNFYPCEKVSEESKAMIIGNLDDGFDYEKVKRLLNVGKLTEEECKNCFVLRNCVLCSMVADTGNSSEEKLSKELKLKSCSGMRFQFDDRLKDVCALNRCGFKLDQFEVKGEKYV